MIKIFFWVLMLCCSLSASPQDIVLGQVSKAEVTGHLNYLASDDLKGRDTGSPGLGLAADYIATKFESYGLEPGVGHSYFQEVPLIRRTVGSNGILKLGPREYQLNTDFIILNGLDVRSKSELIFAGYGLESGAEGKNDFQDLDLRGKVVIVLAGYPEQEKNNLVSIAELSSQKRQLARKMGAIGLIEIFALQIPWQNIVRNFGRSRLVLQEDQNDDQGFFHCWIKLSREDMRSLFADQENIPVFIEADGVRQTKVKTSNVLGIIRGTDPEIRNKYLLLSAHYDHVGTASNSAEEDTIFNGARDNALGVSAVLAAAKAISQRPLRHSVIFAAWTAEEKGLLGSRYFSQNPIVQASDIIFNWNNDNGGYDDTKIVSVVGLDRTTAGDAIRSACRAAGLQAYSDPSLHDPFFNRSDNVNFARLGIPAPTFSAGFRRWDEEITRYYHRTTDNPETVDLDYLYRFCLAYTYSAYFIDQLRDPPFWYPDDPYYDAGLKLYGKTKSP